MRFPIAALFACAFAPVALSAQAHYDAPKTRVEVMGLKHWTLPMLRDSIRHYVPGQDLHDAACMVTLREKLGFADALVSSYEGVGGSAPEFLLIKLVEPQERERVRWNAVPVDSFQSLRPDYASLVLPVTDTAGGVWIGRLMNWLQYGDSTSRVLAATSFAKRRQAPTAVDDANRLTAFLRTQQGETARQRAVRAVQHDGLWVNRMSAAVVLSNFSAHDSTWYALAHALRDPHESVRAAATSTLTAMPARAVDWTPSVGDLRALLAGTNVSAINQVFRLLVRTQIDPQLASALLRDNGRWLLDHLGSEAPGVANDARALLVRLNGGRDLGTTRSAWETWVAAL